MERTTIDFGIDLGTTNSAIAVLDGVNTQIVKNNDDKDITPSAVYIKKSGEIYTGDRAKNALERDNLCDNAFVEFKRRMGSDFEYVFPASGQRKRPEDLSAEILKSLRGDVSQRLGEDVKAAVITIPAMFEQAQCAATKEAGRLAGFAQTALLQEPVAASLAYGFQKEISSKSFWLVFDFGGGTFDAAVMKAEEGDIQIVNHGGDNYLGGADIDWAIIDTLVLPRLKEAGNFEGIKRGAAKWRATLARVKRAVEIAKIDLSRKDKTEIEGLSVTDADGELIDFEMALTRNEVASLAEPFIVRAADICRKVLAEKNLPVSALEKTILVGGPTLAPYFRDILADNLKVPLDLGVDPMTVVARGAAVFAGTQRMAANPARRAAAAEQGVFTAALKYSPVGPDEDPPVAGEVSAPDGSSVAGYSLEFYNNQTMWSSGRIPLKEGGKFSRRLLAEAGMKNDFSILLYAPDGSKRKIEPSSLSYIIGMTIKNQTVTNDIAIEIADNKKVTMVAKGEAYPFRKINREFKSDIFLKAGTDDILRIPILEGDHEKADCNKFLGEIVIKASALRRDLPIASEIDVTLEAREPGTIKVNAYIPILDEEVDAVIEYKTHAPEKGWYKDQLDLDRDFLRGLEEKGDCDTKEAAEALERAEKLVAAAEDWESKQQAMKAIIEARMKLHALADAAAWPEKEAAANERMGWLDVAVEKFGTTSQKSEAEALKAEVMRALERKNLQSLERALERVDEFRLKLEVDRPEFWKSILSYQYSQRNLVTDQRKADILFAQGAKAIQAGDVQEMRRVAGQLWKLLPEEVVEKAQRGYGSGLTV